jgi:hypothetical protein
LGGIIGEIGPGFIIGEVCSGEVGPGCRIGEVGVVWIGEV